MNALKELYHLRWNVETSYRTLKSSMKLEEFSGLKPQIITQDVYIRVFVFILIQDLIGYVERVRPIQVEKY